MINLLLGIVSNISIDIFTRNLNRWFSIQKWVVERVLIPDAVLVKDEELVGRCVPEDKVLIEDVAHPHQFILDGVSVNLFEILDVHNKFVVTAEEPTLMEDNLLTVGQQFSMPAEVSLLRPSSWHVGEWNQHW